MEMAEYRGYRAAIEYSMKDQVFYGKLSEIRDLVNFECDHAAGLEQEFHAAVDDYLAYCGEVGKEPEKAQGYNFTGANADSVFDPLHRIARLVVSCIRRRDFLQTGTGKD